MITRDFVLAGSAIFTVANDKGDHYTYRVRRKEDSRGEVYFVSLLTGPENTSDYTYVGILDKVTGKVRLTIKSKYNAASTPVQVVQWAVRLIWGLGDVLPPGYSIEHAGRCGRCGRTLTVPESIESGIGPECARTMGITRSSNRRQSDNQLSLLESEE